MRPEIDNQKSKIVIVGAGPAGSSAAIRLAQKGFEVTLVEKELFPREKLCGEFISPECFRHFEELGVREEMFSRGGDRITETIFYSPGGRSVSVPSNWFDPKAAGALGLSRAEMDAQLLKRARNVGVNVLPETNATGLIFENDAVRGLRIRGPKGETAEIATDLLIDATGRARVLGKLAEKHFHVRMPIQKNRLIGFKTHLRNIELKPGRCEIYFFRGGYGGLNYVENGIGNHCFLITADVVREYNGDADRILSEVIFQNRRAAATLENATPVYDWLAVSVDGFGLKELNPAPGLLLIGDAGAFIDPFTGSGMLMAMQSAEILANTVLENKLNARLAPIFKSRYHDSFRTRLRICSLMRRAAFAPKLASFVIFSLSFGANPRRLLAAGTRSSD